MKVNLRSLVVAISFASSTGLAHAQDNDQSINTKQVSYIIPQKPEEISPLLNGEKIPMAQLPDVSGKIFDLNKAVSEKPTILIFYRGGWCPYCNKQLSGLRKAAPELEKLGYQLIAVSTDAPEGLMQTAKKDSLSYTLLSDADLSFAKQFGLAYKAPMEKWEILLKSTHGKDIDLLLPVTSVFILDKKGLIQFEYINPDFHQRMNTDLLKTIAAFIKKDL